MIKLSRVLVVPILIILITTFLTPFLFAKDGPIFSAKDAGGWSVFVDGLGEGVVEDVTDEATGEEAIKFDYTANKGSFIGVWTQGLSNLLKEDQVNSIKVGIKTTTPEQLKDISVNGFR